MNRKHRRTILSLTRRQKWNVLADHIPLTAVFNAMDHVEKLTPAERRGIGRSRFAQKHEAHRRGKALLRLYG